MGKSFARAKQNRYSLQASISLGTFLILVAHFLVSCSDINNNSLVANSQQPQRRLILDDLFLKSERNLTISSLGNIDSINGFRMVKLGLNIDSIEFGSFKHENVFGEILRRLSRIQSEEEVLLFFYKNKLAKIEIKNDSSRLKHDGIYISKEDVLNTFGKANVESITTSDKKYSTKTTSLKWRSAQNVEIKYSYTVRPTYHFQVDGHYQQTIKPLGTTTSSSFQYTVTNLPLWEKYEIAQFQIHKQMELEEKMMHKRNDSIRIVNSQNNM